MAHGVKSTGHILNIRCFPTGMDKLSDVKQQFVGYLTVFLPQEKVEDALA